MINAYGKLWSKNPQGQRSLGRPDVDGRMIIKWIMNYRNIA
jgi:hypothetical protein